MELINFNVLDRINIGLEKTVSAISNDDSRSELVKLDQISAADIARRISETDIHFMSNGKISLHEIVSAILEERKGVNIYLSTFSFTETPARMLALWKEQCVISQLQVLLDVRGRANYPEVLQLLQQISDGFKMISTHAKVTIIEDGSELICITGSQNWTQNPRIEIGHITQNKSIAAFHRQWIAENLKTEIE